jgi:L-fucose isomerase-like protein
MVPRQQRTELKVKRIDIKEVILVASGDLRLSANQEGWPAQEAMEIKLEKAFKAEGVNVVRGHPYDPKLKHGFIWNQRMGMDIFQKIPKKTPLVVAESVWQYSHHLLAGLRDHKGPILTVANWSGQWPGLVGMLNLNACLTKMGVDYSTLWSENFDDEFFIGGLKQWLSEGKIIHDTSHVRNLKIDNVHDDERQLGKALAETLMTEKCIMGVFDEGCMGMYNAIIEDDLLNQLGVYKERLSQSALVAAMKNISDDEAREIKRWLSVKGVRFITGVDEATELTNRQIIEQCKMYIAAVRMASKFGCSIIGIQYQQGLKDMTPASDLAEGLLNNVDRPPVYDELTGEELYPGQALPHFNEVDECAGLDALITNKVWVSFGYDPPTTLHDIRWGDWYGDDFVWVFMISGGAPPSHFRKGYRGAVSERQPPMYFPLGGGTLKGDCRPGEIVWSRIFVEGGRLHADIGRATILDLPPEETKRRWDETTPQWPIMSALLHVVTIDQMMFKHKSNHIQVVYAPTANDADKALAVKAVMLHELGVKVHLCGDIKVG